MSASRSFFCKLKSLLKAEYGGRYFAAILSEVIQNDEAVGKVFSPEYSAGKHRVRTEFTVPGIPRRADLSLLEEDSDTPLLLVECKCEDEKGDASHAQLVDYLSLARRQGIPFLYLTKKMLPKRDMELISEAKSEGAPVSHMLWGRLQANVATLKSNSVLTRMFIDYMKEELVMYDSGIPQEDMSELLKRLIGSQTVDQLRARHLMVGTGDVFATILRNCECISSWLANCLSVSRPRIDYSFTRRYRNPLPEECIKGECVELRQEALSTDSGEWFVWTRTKHDQYYLLWILRYGLSNKQDSVAFSVGCAIYTAEDECLAERYEPLAIGADWEEVRQGFAGALHRLTMCKKTPAVIRNLLSALKQSSAV